MCMGGFLPPLAPFPAATTEKAIWDDEQVTTSDSDGDIELAPFPAGFPVAPKMPDAATDDGSSVSTDEHPKSIDFTENPLTERLKTTVAHYRKSNINSAPTLGDPTCRAILRVRWSRSVSSIRNECTVCN